VTDYTGSGVPDIKVTVTNQATKVEREIRTGADGTWTLLLPPAVYAVGVEKAGQGTFAVKDIDLAANATQTVNMEFVAASEDRNFRYMFYGFLAAWLVLVIYVISLASRERGLRRQIEGLRRMVESERHV
jgi:CcmD family protein